LLCVLLFDFLFVPPRFSLAVGDVQYVITLGVMLAVALITAHFTTGLKRQAEVASRREREARSCMRSRATSPAPRGGAGDGDRRAFHARVRRHARDDAAAGRER
jgi:two-component system sensor histidine kinase KdpD